MLKFRCQHCGQRIAVPPRHLGKLVTCGECGATTHPVAQGLVEKTKAATESTALAPQASTVPASSDCANCGRMMGRLQATHAWRGHTVCGACIETLRTESETVSRAADGALSPVRRVGAESTAGADTVVDLKERAVRALVVFVVAVVALYGALSLLRDLAGLIAVVSVAILALLALYAVFRGAAAARQKAAASAGPHPKVISARTAV